MTRINRLAIWGLLLVCPILAALDKPRIALRFSLVEPAYRKALEDPQILAIEDRVREYLTLNLGAKIRFMDFVGPGQSEHVLQFTLIREDIKDMDQKPLVGDVIFRIDFQSPGREPAPPERWPFRGSDEINKVVGEVQDFEKEITDRLSEADVKGLLQNHLSQVSIADQGKLLPVPSLENTEDLEWKLILPFRQMEICMEVGTKLNVLLNIPTALGIRPKSYPAEVVLIFDPPGQTQLEDWRQCMLSDIHHASQDILHQFQSMPDDIDIGGIYVTDYLFNRTSCRFEITPPDEAEFQEEDSP